jgi:hypothetical protein
MSDRNPILLPDGAIVDAVAGFAGEASPSFLMRHNYRTFLFGRMLVPGDIDVEAAFVASMLHDIGLVDPHIGQMSFEEVGADIAAHFLEARSWPIERIQLVEQAIVRHVDLAPHDTPEMRVVQAGAAFDVAGFPPDAVSYAATATILSTYPRGSMARDIRAAMHAEIDRQPEGVFAVLDKQIRLTELVMQNPLDRETHDATSR